MRAIFFKVMGITSFLLLNTLLFAQQETTRKVCASDAFSIPFAECEQIPGRLDQLQLDIDACCQNLQNRCDEAQLTVLGTFTCEQGIGIDQTFIDTATPQITQSGVYCLIEDVDTSTQALVIDADDVVVDLNGFVMSGGATAIAATGHTNLQIVNGRVDSTQTAGIMLSTCTTVIVADIDFTTVTGQSVSFVDVNGFTTKDCTVVGADTISDALGHFDYENCSNGTVSCCTVHNSTNGRGFAFNNCFSVYCSFLNISNTTSILEGYCIENGSTNITFESSKFNNNTTGNVSLTGFSIVGNNILIRKCQANNNISENNARGFLIGVSSENVVVDSCQALNNQKAGAGSQTMRGFQIVGIRTCVLNCTSKNNIATGTGNARGFDVTGTDSYLWNNIALNNSNQGFRDIGTDNIFFGNYAQANGTNYSITSDPNETFDLSDGTLTGTPVIWNNIDAQP